MARFVKNSTYMKIDRNSQGYKKGTYLHINETIANETYVSILVLYHPIRRVVLTKPFVNCPSFI